MNAFRPALTARDANMRRTVRSAVPNPGRAALPRRPIIRPVRSARDESSENSRFIRVIRVKPVPFKYKKLPNEPILEFSICLQTKKKNNKAYKTSTKNEPIFGLCSFDVQRSMFDVRRSTRLLCVSVAKILSLLIKTVKASQALPKPEIFSQSNQQG
jgi:hypothetical protein